MAAMEELGTLLQSLQALKPPGVTKTTIAAITATCVENVQSDSTIVQKIVQQFANSKDTHKLGVLYVIDSVARQWLERAKKAGQAISKNAAPGTFASGVQQMTDVLPHLMNNIVQCAPENQKEKISKLLDIWERGQTFPLEMLAGFKRQLIPTNNYNPASATQSQVSGPVGPTNAQAVAPPAPVAAAGALPTDPNAMLASLAQPPAQPNAMPVAPPPPFANNMFPPPPPGFVAPLPGAANGQPAMPSLPPGSEVILAQIMQAVGAGTITADQAQQVIAMMLQQNGQVPVPPPQLPVVSQAPPAIAPNGVPQTQQTTRFEPEGFKPRDRSRSPDYNRRRRSSPRRSPPNRRESPTYGVYDPNAGADSSNMNRQDRGDRGRGRGRNRGGRQDRNEYRQRTPPPPRRQPSPAGNASRGTASKFIDRDNTLPRDHIKVLSRTLFVGGAGGNESEIRSIFSRFGRVQTCIVNQEKRHAFVKMLTRPDAVAAKEAMDNVQDPATLSKARQTRWGVGFGPRECSDYTTGISVIPISRLTDADRKWVLTAEHGGTGGIPLEGGLVIEEPDIEIGAGVSSKAISRRVPQDSGRGRGRGGGFGDRGGFDSGRGRFRNERPNHHEPRQEQRPEPAVAVPPAIPGFGFQLPGF